MATFNITCSGPGPHIPASGILGTSDRPQTADVRCASPSCVKPEDPAVANQQTLQQQAQAALVANRNDQNQDQTIITNAATITGTNGTLTSAQLSNFVRQLAQAVSILAGNDANAKKELNAITRLMLQQFDATN